MSDKPNRVLRLREVEQRIGLKRSTIYEMVQAGMLPKPRNLGRRAIGWLETDIEDWIHSRPQVDHLAMV